MSKLESKDINSKLAKLMEVSSQTDVTIKDKFEKFVEETKNNKEQE